MIFKLYLTAWYIWSFLGISFLLIWLWDQVTYSEELIWFVILASGLFLVLGGAAWIVGLIWVQ